MEWRYFDRAYFTLHDIHEGVDLRSERCNVSRWFPGIYYIENINSREEDCDGLRTWFIQPNVATARAGSDKEVHLICNDKYSVSPVRFDVSSSSVNITGYVTELKEHTVLEINVKCRSIVDQDFYQACGLIRSLKRVLIVCI